MNTTDIQARTDSNICNIFVQVFKNIDIEVPQGVGGNGHDAFRALLRGKARGVLQGLVRERRQVEARLVRVAEPGAAGHGQHLKQRQKRRRGSSVAPFLYM